MECDKRVKRRVVEREAVDDPHGASIAPPRLSAAPNGLHREEERRCRTSSVSTVSIRTPKPWSPITACCAFSFSYTNCCRDTLCTGSSRASCRGQREGRRWLGHAEDTQRTRLGHAER
ncbi:hypothetical protein EYF80_025249 [Liparis tanakae]|uniref:Uncharacterized protein n=1 Tax=Liparis tanakae TaxID=230148 RepID=A0A4Z2HFX3_9TELE|nr:hypothetical protein EYF80_025249 [Liparis tanakae]